MLKRLQGLLVKYKKKILIGCTFLLAAYFIFNNIHIKAELYFNSKTRGSYMEGQLRYATYRIWDGFQEGYSYQFDIEEEKKDIYCDIRIELFENMTLDNVIKSKINEYKINNFYFEESEIQNIKISKNNAFFIQFEYNELENSNPEYDFTEITEFIFIENQENIIMITNYAWKEYFENGRKIWEDFYNSFRTDLSQPYKLKFGSFIPPELMEDYSHFHYSIDGPEDYSIDIKYIEDIEDRKSKTMKRGIAFMASLLPDTKIKIIKSQKLKIDTKKAQFIEIETMTGDDIEEAVFFTILDDLKPGLEITVGSSNPKLFKLYRGEMEELFKSLKFDENP